MEVIKVENLTKSYDTHKAVDNVSFSIEAGKVVGIIGVNSAGKTTMLYQVSVCAKGFHI